MTMHLCSVTALGLIVPLSLLLTSLPLSLSPLQPSLSQCLHHRAVNPGTPLPSMEQWLKDALERPSAISERCQAPLEEMKRKFPLKAVEKKKELKTGAQIFGKGYAQGQCRKGSAAFYCEKCTLFGQNNA